jgi:hypothetical protein
MPVSCNISAYGKRQTVMVIRLLIAMLALAICIQNTCPCGREGKSSFLSLHVSHNPINQNMPSPPAGDNGRKYPSCLKPLLVFQISTPDTAAHIYTPVSGAVSFLYDSIKDVFPEPLFRPPIYPLSA